MNLPFFSGNLPVLSCLFFFLPEKHLCAFLILFVFVPLGFQLNIQLPSDILNIYIHAILYHMDRKTFAGTTIFSAISLFHLFERFTMDPQFSWLPKRCAAKEYSSGGPAFGFQFQRFGR